MSEGRVKPNLGAAAIASVRSFDAKERILKQIPRLTAEDHEEVQSALGESAALRVARDEIADLLPRMDADAMTISNLWRDVRRLTRENRVLKSVIASHPGIRQAIEEAKAAIEAGDTITLEELEAELERHPDNADRIAEQKRAVVAVVEAAKDVCWERDRINASSTHRVVGSLSLRIKNLQVALDAAQQPQPAE